MKRFQKTVENFTCDNCGFHVKGDGYTNHCPQCLFSKHVDVNPGDRAAECGGLMEPVSCETEGGGYVLTHKCRLCGHTKRNKLSDNDNFDELVRIGSDTY